MRILWTLIWSLLLCNMIYYVIGAMNQIPYNPTSASIVGVILAIFVMIIGEALPNSSEEA